MSEHTHNVPTDMDCISKIQLPTGTTYALHDARVDTLQEALTEIDFSYDEQTGLLEMTTGNVLNMGQFRLG